MEVGSEDDRGVLMPKFHYIYLARDLIDTCLKRVCDQVSDIHVFRASRGQVGDMSLTNFLLKTCRRLARRQVSDKIDVMKFALYWHHVFE